MNRDESFKILREFLKNRKVSTFLDDFRKVSKHHIIEEELTIGQFLYKCELSDKATKTFKDHESFSIVNEICYVMLTEQCWLDPTMRDIFKFFEEWKEDPKNKHLMDEMLNEILDTQEKMLTHLYPKVEEPFEICNGLRELYNDWEEFSKFWLKWSSCDDDLKMIDKRLFLIMKSIVDVTPNEDVVVGEKDLLCFKLLISTHKLWKVPPKKIKELNDLREDAVKRFGKGIVND